MMLVIQTQYMENYGAHDWDGTGTCPSYWKAKGGSEYKVLNTPLNIDYQEVVNMMVPRVEKYSNYSMESIVSWTLQADDYLSAFEKGQLDYEGEIVFAEPSIDYDELMETV
jgi:hypothetical protein